ncbi:MAG: M24 family metallopeptidase, partial [Planctomycetota bacterium]|nr:M24 family metallopeptidase [Planctomycetota bacterium]
GMPEYEIAAYIHFGFMKRGAQGLSFHHIVAGGANALSFHHLAGQRSSKEGELVLMDVGANYGYYASDVTRTVPVSGKFSEEQKKLYEALLKAQETAIAKVKPGVTLADIHRTALQSLREAGLDSYVGHSTCHYVGMAAHDPGVDVSKLEPGVVITVEPGIYLRDKDIGIRIEDTVVVTENGCRVLSDGAPKSVDEIEKLMGGGK